MKDFIPFVIQHWELWLAFVVVLGYWLSFEYQEHRHGGLRITAQQLVILMNRHNALVIDVRDADLFKKSHILGAVSFPGRSVLDQLHRIKKHQQKHVVLVDANGQTVAKLARDLAQKEFQQVGYLKNGLNGWQQANLPLQKDA